MSNREARKALETGKVYLLDAPTASAARVLEAPEQLSVRANAPRVRVGVDAVIVYRDQHLAVVAKPSGMLSVPAPGRRRDRTVIGEVSRAIGGVLAVHRLDEATSGVMLVARTESAQRQLKQLWTIHDIERRYLALVGGRFPSEPITVHNWLVRNRGDGKRGAGDADAPDAREAITHLSFVEAVGAGASLIEARLDTGRTHQVRIHAAGLGHPILGDPLYGGRRGSRLALHAHVLAFPHPVTKKRLRFVAPLADDLDALRRRLAT
jgi:23S rRNA pseudouridine1911/1915/1917 synthase